MKEGVIKLTDQEANELVLLIDLAVKSKGLEVAGNAAFFLEKIKEAFKQVKEEKPNKQTNK